MLATPYFYTPRTTIIQKTKQNKTKPNKQTKNHQTNRQTNKPTTKISLSWFQNSDQSTDFHFGAF